MTRYQAVVFRKGVPAAWETLKVRAPNVQAAYAEIRARNHQPDVYHVSVRRRGPLGFRRRERLTVTIRDGGRGGAAGVREPRRPKPAPPSLRIELDEP